MTKARDCSSDGQRCALLAQEAVQLNPIMVTLLGKVDEIDIQIEVAIDLDLAFRFADFDFEIHEK